MEYISVGAAWVRRNSAMCRAATAAAALLLQAALAAADLAYYSAWDGSPVPADQAQAADDEYKFWCLNQFESQCSAEEWRSLDGSCNNLAQPRAGAGHHRFARLLPADFRTNADGKLDGASEEARRLRTTAMALGRVDGNAFSQLTILYLSFVNRDIDNILRHDNLNYITVHKDCCGVGAGDPMCYTLAVPEDDPVLRYSKHRCMNMTFPISFQSQRCLPTDTAPDTLTPERVNIGAPFFDLSQMYGNRADTLERQRLFSGGLLNYTDGGTGLQWPTVRAAEVDRNDGIESLPDHTFPAATWYWREHNRLAAALHHLNPCWDDEQLFQVARDINIAEYAQVLYYDMWAKLMGKEQLVAGGVLGASGEHRDVYDARAPQLFAESLFALRWFHSVSDGLTAVYTNDGRKIMDYHVAASPLTWDGIGPDKSGTLPGIMQGMFRQSTGKYDNVIDPELGQRVSAHLEEISDVASIDISKGRLMGIPKYDKILEYSDGKDHSTWESLADYQTDDNVKLLRSMYGSVSEVDWIVAMWLETRLQQANMPKTFYSTLLPQLVNSVRADRHWYERADRPHAFSAEQLNEVRKATLGRLLCDNAESVAETGVPKDPFFLLSDDNPLVSCDSLPALDLSPWKDAACAAAAAASQYSCAV